MGSERPKPVYVPPPLPPVPMNPPPPEYLPPQINRDDVVNIQEALARIEVALRGLAGQIEKLG